MKTLDVSTVAADPVISELRRAKTEFASAYGFDVIAMVRALRQIDSMDTVEVDSPADDCTTTSLICREPDGD